MKPTLIVGQLDGTGMPDAGFDRVLYFIIAETEPQTFARSIDKRAASATFRAEDGSFTVPPRTAVVFVLER